jgi:hypothetical protein
MVFSGYEREYGYTDFLALLIVPKELSSFGRFGLEWYDWVYRSILKR